MEEFERLINNFEYDRRRANMLDENLVNFLQDLKIIAQDVGKDIEEQIEEAIEKAYEEGKDDGRDEALPDVNMLYDDLDDLIDNINRFKEKLEGYHKF